MVQFRCGWERDLFILVRFLKYNFPFESFQNVPFRGYLILLVLIDNCGAFFVNVHAPFVLNGGMALINLNKEKTLPLWISKEHLFILFYETSFLVRKFILIKWRWDCYQLTCLIPNFFRSLMINHSLSQFGTFIASKEEDVSHWSQNLSRGKNWPIKRPDMHAQGVVMQCLCYAMHFLISPTIFKMFL